jgi:8-amino-7-oxononanoate synthase
LSQRLSDQDINVQPIIHPAIPERLARLRFFISSEHSAEQIERTVPIIASEFEATNATSLTALARGAAAS